MPNGLDRQRLENKIKDLFDYEALQVSDPDQSRQRIAKGIADAIHEYVSDAKIKYLSGLAAGSTPVTGNFNGNLE